MLLAGNSLYGAMLRSTLYGKVCACASDLNKPTLITLTVNNNDKTFVEKRISASRTLQNHNPIVENGELYCYWQQSHLGNLLTTPVYVRDATSAVGTNPMIDAAILRYKSQPDKPPFSNPIRPPHGGLY